MKTIKTILAVAILFFTVQTTVAQKVKKGNPYINKVVTYVTAEASLSTDEATGIKEILTTLSESKKEIKALKGEAKKLKNKELYQNRNKSLNKLLGKVKAKAVTKAISAFQKSQKKK